MLEYLLDIGHGVLIALVAVIAILLYVILHLLKMVMELKKRNIKLVGDKTSLVVKHGLSWEQFVPWMKGYPFDPNNFKFIGNPIDGLSFEDDNIYFVEIKTGRAKLTSRQRQIRDLVKNKKVKWIEIRDGENIPDESPQKDL